MKGFPRTSQRDGVPTSQQRALDPCAPALPQEPMPRQARDALEKGIKLAEAIGGRAGSLCANALIG